MTTMVRASGISGYIAVMRGLGIDPAPLLLQHHIDPAILQDDDALLSLRAVTHLLEASNEASGCPDLGLRIAQEQHIGTLGPLGVVIQNAETVYDALQLTSRYLFTHSPGLAVTSNPVSPLVEGAFELAVEIQLSGRPSQRQNIDLCLGTSHRIAQFVMGSQYRLKLVTLPHAPSAPLSSYRRFFNAPVIAEQERAALHLDAAVLHGKIQGSNPALRQITEDYLSRHFRMPGDIVSVRVRQALKRMLGTTYTSKSDIAAMLALHPRTLHRRLQAEGTHFEAIKESVRQELALQYLRETRVPLSQIADILGYPEQSAFTRSCKRWFGQTPSSFRREPTC
ncbi:AraC family transcriptional regulator [Pseudomonas chlororaphis]|jgi:AraC-like DNA-binding protein|nr:transcriptional regulator, AraC family [Pseudomonas chlororaphis subsp. aureofaciens 30-84]ROL80408.1 AraC family transcriptional regulator [Pseudomonas chlororaphis]